VRAINCVRQQQGTGNQPAPEGERSRNDRYAGGALHGTDAHEKGRLRSRAWFDNADNPDMTALYIERYLNFA